MFTSRTIDKIVNQIEQIISLKQFQIGDTYNCSLSLRGYDNIRCSLSFYRSKETTASITHCTSNESLKLYLRFGASLVTNDHVKLIYKSITIELKISISEQKSNNDVVIQETCLICQETFQSSNDYCCDSKHSVCDTCLVQHIQISCDDLKIPIRCPGLNETTNLPCKTLLFNGDQVKLRKIISNQEDSDGLIAKFDHAEILCATNSVTIKNGIIKNYNCINCQGVLTFDIYDGEGIPVILNCSLCKKSYCTGCCKIFNSGTDNCKEFQNYHNANCVNIIIHGSNIGNRIPPVNAGKEAIKRFITLQMEKAVPTCPKCKYPTTKSDGGCNKITCKQCDTQWCFVCEKIIARNVSEYLHLRETNKKNTAIMVYDGVEISSLNDLIMNNNHLYHTMHFDSTNGQYQHKPPFLFSDVLVDNDTLCPLFLEDYAKKWNLPLFDNTMKSLLNQHIVDKETKYVANYLEFRRIQCFYQLQYTFIKNNRFDIFVEAVQDLYFAGKKKEDDDWYLRKLVPLPLDFKQDKITNIHSNVSMCLQISNDSQQRAFNQQNKSLYFEPAILLVKGRKHVWLPSSTIQFNLDSPVQFEYQFNTERNKVVYSLMDVEPHYSNIKDYYENKLIEVRNKINSTSTTTVGTKRLQNFENEEKKTPEKRVRMNNKLSVIYELPFICIDEDEENEDKNIMSSLDIENDGATSIETLVETINKHPSSKSNRIQFTHLYDSYEKYVSKLPMMKTDVVSSLKQKVWAVAKVSYASK